MGRGRSNGGDRDKVRGELEAVRVGHGFKGLGDSVWVVEWLAHPLWVLSLGVK